MIYWKKFVGVILIIVGVSGLLLPIIPGIALIIVGLILLENKKLLDWTRNQWNKFKR